MIVHRSPVLDTIHAPEENTHAVHQSNDGDDSEGPGRGHRDAVAEVEEGRCYRTQDDGEFELLRRVSEMFAELGVMVNTHPS